MIRRSCSKMTMAEIRRKLCHNDNLMATGNTTLSPNIMRAATRSGSATMTIPCTQEQSTGQLSPKPPGPPGPPVASIMTPQASNEPRLSRLIISRVLRTRDSLASSRVIKEHPLWPKGIGNETKASLEW